MKTVIKCDPTSPAKRLEILESKTWLTVQDIKKVADCGEYTARKNLKSIIAEIEAEGYLVPSITQVPTDRVIRRLSINLDFLRLQTKSAPKSLATERALVESSSKDSTPLYHFDLKV